MPIGRSVSDILKELASNKKVWQELVQEGIDTGDNALQTAARNEMKAISELERQYGKLPVAAGKGTSKESIGIPRGQEAEYLSKQLEQSKSRLENLQADIRRKSKEAQQRGFAQGTGEVIPMEGTKALEPYKAPGLPSTARKIRETEPVTGELMERVKRGPAAPEVIDVEARPYVPPKQLAAAKGDEGGVYIREEPNLRGSGEKRAGIQLDEQGNELAAAINKPKNNYMGGLTGAGLLTLGPTAFLSGDKTAFPGEKSTEQLDQEREAEQAKKAEQATSQNRQADEARLKELTGGIDAMTGLLKAQGASPNPEVVQRLEAFQKERRDIEARLSPATPSAVETPMAPTTIAAEEGKLPSTLTEALTQETKPAVAKKPGIQPKPEPVATEPSLFDRLAGERATAKAEREAAMQRADIGELASLVGRSLTQIGAAYQGAKTGTDMSNVAQQTLINWDKRRDQIMDEYKQTIGELDKQQTSLEREKERADNLAERAADRASREAYQTKSLELQAKNAELADRRLNQQWEMAMLRNELDMAKLMSKKDAKGIQDLTKKYTGQLKDVDAEMDKLRAIQAMDVAGKKKPQEVAAALAELYGREIAEEPGTFYGTNVKSKKQIAEIVKGKLDTLQVQKDRLNNLIANGVKYEAVQEAPAAGEQEPAATTPAPTPGQDPKVSDYAKLYTNGDYAKAKAILIGRGYTPKE